MYNTSNRSESVLPLNFSTRTVCSCRAVATLSLSSVTALSSACTYMYMYICNNVAYSVHETTHTTGTITKNTMKDLWSLRSTPRTQVKVT